MGRVLGFRPGCGGALKPRAAGRSPPTDANSACAVTDSCIRHEVHDSLLGRSPRDSAHDHPAAAQHEEPRREIQHLGSSLEIRMIELPPDASASTRRWISDFAPTSTLGGLVEDEDAALGGQPLRSTTFCWLPPERPAAGCSRPNAHAEPLKVREGQHAPPQPVAGRVRARRDGDRQRRVTAGAHGQDEARGALRSSGTRPSPPASPQPSIEEPSGCPALSPRR